MRIALAGPGFGEPLHGGREARGTEGQGGLLADGFSLGFAPRQEESGDEIERMAAFQLKQVVEDLSDDLRFIITQTGFEAQYEDGLFAFHLRKGAQNVGADGDGVIGEGVDEVAEQEATVDTGAGGERQGAGAAQSGGGILFPAPDGLHLDVAQTAEEGSGLAVLHGDQCLGNGVLGPTLRIARDGLFEEAVEGAQKVGEEVAELLFGGDLGGFGHDQVDAIGQGLAQGWDGVGGRGLAEAVQGFDFLFDQTARHDSSIAAKLAPFPAGVHPIFGPQGGPTMKRTANAQWHGDLKSGTGTISTASGVLSSTNYSFHTRFEDSKGTNPEELLAAAHAGCFTMAVSAQLAEAGMTAETLETTCTISLEKGADGLGITESHLDLKAKIPGASQAAFDTAVQAAKTGCPVSKLYKTNITLTAVLES